MKSLLTLLIAPTVVFALVQQPDAERSPSPQPARTTPQTTPPLEAVISNQNQPMSLEQAQSLIKQSTQYTPEQIAEMARQAQESQNAPSQLLPQPVRPVHPQTNTDNEKRVDAFNALLDDVLPLTPDQIKRLHRYYDLTLQAKSETPNPPPTPNFTSIVVNLSPGSVPPVVRLSAGFVSSILFVDSTGAAWPITAYSIGDPQSFNIQWDQKGNALFIQSMKQYAHGNLAVRLWGLDTPVMLTLVSGQKQVDFRVDLQVPGRGPDAKPAVVDATAHANVNPLLINILDGIPPRDSVKLSVSGGYGDAWLADGRIYFRTKLTLLSPAWTSKVSSADGTYVYELMQTPSVLASDNGKAVDIKLSGL